MNFYQPQLTYIPSTITNRAVMVYLLALVGCNLLFISHPLDITWWVFGIVEVLTFFILSNTLTKKWSYIRRGDKWFAKSVFWTAFTLRLAYVLVTYWFYMVQCGDAWGYENGDPTFYDDAARIGAQWLIDGKWNLMEMLRQNYNLGGVGRGLQFSDTGFPIYLSLIYFLVGNDPVFSILLMRLFNCILGAWTVVLMYRLSQRHFGESTARIVAILCVLMPNLIYYCGTGLKEVLMVFLTVLFIERADNLMRRGKFMLLPTLGLVLIAFYMFMMRTVLAATLLLAFMTALVLSSQRVVKSGKRILLIGISLCFLVVMVLQNTSIMGDVQSLIEERGSGQKANMEWRSQRENGNQFAKYAGAAVFAPMIFTIPFPTMVETPGQEHLKMIHGGDFCKNIMSFFTIFALVLLLKNRQWKRHVLPLAIMCGYLVVLVFSKFAQSERFHQPIICFELMFAALAISRFKEKKKYNTYYVLWLGVMFIAAIAWNWFKLKGRGMI
ncbi:MAG: hypothetical protein KBT06_00075 [Prevotellaceae bacterium]|nr:hypothetical protein [Candidatus Colivivens equi]